MAVVRRILQIDIIIDACPNHAPTHVWCKQPEQIHSRVTELLNTEPDCVLVIAIVNVFLWSGYFGTCILLITWQERHVPHACAGLPASCPNARLVLEVLDKKERVLHYEGSDITGCLIITSPGQLRVDTSAMRATENQIEFEERGILIPLLVQVPGLTFQWHLQWLNTYRGSVNLWFKIFKKIFSKKVTGGLEESFYDLFSYQKEKTSYYTNLWETGLMASLFLKK